MHVFSISASMTEEEKSNKRTDSSRSPDDVSKRLPVACASLPRETTNEFNCPVVVYGSVKPCTGLGNLDLTTECFRVVDKAPEVPTMELRIKSGLPHKEMNKDKDGNSWLVFWFPGMKCQVSVTLQKNPILQRPFTFHNWEVIIMQMFECNNEIRYYGQHRDPDSVDFHQKQYFQVDHCQPSKSNCPKSILDTLDCTCNAQDPAYGANARQCLSEENLKDIEKGKLLFGKLSSKDQPTSAARVFYHPKKETDSTMNTFFRTQLGGVNAETYYLNKIEKHSSILTYLTIYNTKSCEFYTPMAVTWFFDCTVRRVRDTGEFEFYQTTDNQRRPVGWTNTQLQHFPSFPSGLLQYHNITCRASKTPCRGYATFNNSISTYPKLPEFQLTTNL